MNYKTENLNELIYLCYQGDEDAFAHLASLLKPITQGVFYDVLAMNAEVDFDEWMDSSNAFLHECVFRYHMGSSTPFVSFWRYSLRNKARDLQRHLIRYKKYFSNQPIPMSVHDDNEKLYRPGLLEDRRINVNQQALDEVWMSKIFNIYQQELTKDQLQMITMLYAGYTKKAVLEKMNCKRPILEEALVKAREIYTELTGRHV